MEKDFTELIFILDKSGSMSGLEKDTIGGYNSVLKKQQEVEGECRITTVLFDHGYELLHDRIDLKAVSPVTEKEYQVGGSTALLDAIGRTINKIDGVQKNTAEEFRTKKVMFVIITDGEENSSREFSSDKIKSMVKERTDKQGWEFIFLGANIDAVETAAHYGIRPDRAAEYLPDGKGTQVSYKAVARAAVMFRDTGHIDEEALEYVREDTQKRKKGK